MILLKGLVFLMVQKSLVRKREMERRNEKKNYYRIRVYDHFNTEIGWLDFLKDNILVSDSVEILIENIGPGGLRFVSNLDLTDNQKVVYSFESDILETEIRLPGEIIWSEEVSDGLYRYGFHFNIPENTRDIISDLLKTSKMILI